MKKEIPQTNFTGSEKTSSKVQAQIAQRFGVEEAKKYDPSANCRTFKSWLSLGFKVKKGEKALKSFIVLKGINEKNEEQTRVKTINLFYIKQVELIKA